MITSPPGNRDEPELERHALSSLALQLVEAEDSTAVAEALRLCCDALFQWDAFIFSESVDGTDLFSIIMAFDTIGGTRVHMANDTGKQFRSRRTVAEGRAFLIDDAEEVRALDKFGDNSQSSLSLLFAPIRFSGNTYGIVSVQSYKAHCYCQEDVELIQALADIVAPAMRRIQAEKALRWNEERYRHAIAQADAVLYETDLSTGRMIYVGEKIQEMIGYLPHEFGNELWPRIIKERIHYDHLKGLSPEQVSERIHDGSFRTYKADYRIVTGDGKSKWLADTSISVLDPQGKPIRSLGILQDITYRKRSELTREALAELGGSLSAISDTKEAARLVMETADRLIGWDACFVNLYDEATHRTFPIIEIDTIEGVRTETGRENEEPKEPGSLFMRTLREGAHLLEAETGRGQLIEYFGATRPSESMLFAPIRRTGSGSIGVLSIQSYTPHAYTQEDLNLLQMLADYCGNALARMSTEEELRHSRQRSLVFSELAHELNSATSDREASLVIARTADRLIGWDAMYISLYDGETETSYNVLNIDTVDGNKKEFPLLPPEARTRMGQKMLREGAFLQLRAAHELEGDPEAAFGVKRRSASLMFVPARKGDKVVAFISIQSYKLNAYTHSHLHDLQAMADHCAGALGRLRTERVLAEEHRRFSSLSRLGLQLSAATVPSEVARVVTDVAQELIGWDATYVTLYDQVENRAYSILNVDTMDGKRTEVPPLYYVTRTVPGPILSRVLTEGAVLILRDKEEKDALNLPRWGDQGKRSESLMFAPIRRQGQTSIGMISLQSYTSNAYSGKDIDLLQVLADHCSSALERTFIEETLRRRDRQELVLGELSQKLSDAHTIHEAGRLIIDYAQELIGWDSSFVHLYDEEKNAVIPIIHMDTIDGERCETKPKDLGKPPTPLTVKTLREGRQLILRKEGEERTDGLDSFGNNAKRSLSLVFVPIFRADSAIGVLSVQSYTERAYDETSCELVERLARHCSGALDRLRAEEAMRESENRYALAARGANDGLWDWNLQTEAVYYSPRWARMLDIAPAQMTTSVNEWFGRIHSADLPNVRQELERHFRGDSEYFQSEHRIRHSNDHYGWVLCRGVAVRDESGRPIRIAGSMTDINERRSAQSQLMKAAFYDELTGLPNRALFMDRLERCLARQKRQRESYRFALLFLDLDRFKMVNDSMGHLVGDKLLQEIALRLQDSIREQDTTARLGGDEFTVILDDLGDFSEIVPIADRILKALAEPFKVDGHELFPGSSMGVALSSADYEETQDILRDADIALYRAKERGRGRYVVFDQHMHQTVMQTIAVENGLRTALRNGEFELYYQPVLSLTEKRLCGFEALLRWNHPSVGVLTPSHFMKVAEETALIIPIGEWVIRRAAEQLLEWRAANPGAADLSMGINLSARQFASPQLPALMEEVLSLPGISPSDLHLEITETAMMEHSEIAKALIDNWHSRGVRILLDDFGTGYSPLAHLMRFPVDYLKIDKSFVGTMAESSESRHIVEAVVSLARILRIGVIAEGVETEEQLAAIRALGCDCAQGYHIGRPMQAEAAAAFKV